MKDTISKFARECLQASRIAVRHPRFFLITMLVLSLGIGMSTALFSIMYGVLLKPLPVQEQNCVVVAWKGDPKDIAHIGELSYPEFQDWRRQSNAFAMMAAMPTTVYGYGVTLAGYGEPVELERTPVSAAFFSLLGAHAVLGRTFLESDDHLGAEATVVLHHSVWKNQFHADPSVIGKTVSLNGAGYTVIGVMSPDFDFPAGAQLWTPLGLNVQWVNRDAMFLQVIGRLNSRVSLQQARNDIAEVMAQVARQYPQYSEPGEFAVITPYADHVFGNNKPAIVLLWAASVLLLTIACINITSLLLARAIVREKEVAVRLALGATREHLVQQFVAEGLVLSSAGAVAGCAVARFLIALVIALAPHDIPRLSSITLNAFSLLFACFASIVIGVGFGLVLAFLVIKRDVRDSLNEGGARTAGSRRGAFFRKSLLIAETTVTMLLLACAGMVVHNFYNLQRVRLGFVPDNALTAQIRLTNVEAARRNAFFTELLGRLRSRPEVSAAGGVLLRPFEGTVGWDVPYQAKSQDIYETKRNPISNFEVVTPGYFTAVGTSLLSGRDFTFDDKDGNQKVMIVSEGLARRAFGSVQRSIGQRISLGRADAPNENTGWCTIIGIVEDAQYRRLGITQGEIFVPFLQTNVPVRYIAIRTRINSESVLPILRQEVAAIDKTLAVSKIRTLGELIADAKTGPRFTMLLFSMFGVFACFLASVGVYGLVSDSIAQRRREMGIRMALGAQHKSVLLLMTQGEMSAVLLGGILSLPFTLGMAPMYDRLLYGLKGIDFLSVTAAFVVLCSVSLTSSIVPTMRATKMALSSLLVE
jgi:putative ABC transport system permease protein